MAQAAEQPDAEMIAAANRLALFIASAGSAPLSDVFAEPGVTIIENFAPYVFEGPNAVAAWSDGMRTHLVGVSDLRHTFGPAHDFSCSGQDAYFSLPTTWRGVARGGPFVEGGGWSFVLTRCEQRWRVRAYGWAVISAAATT